MDGGVGGRQKSHAKGGLQKGFRYERGLDLAPC